MSPERPLPDFWHPVARILLILKAPLAALRRPLPLARCLARQLARGAAPVLRDLAVPAHVLRALPPWLDNLLTQLDCLARPDHWSGIDLDTG